MSDLTIGELAEHTGVPRRTVRYYVEIGLLPPPEGASRAATYSDEHVARLEAIRALQGEGLSLEQVRAALPFEGAELGEVGDRTDSQTLSASTALPGSLRRSLPESAEGLQRRVAPAVGVPRYSAAEYLNEVRGRLGLIDTATRSATSKQAPSGKPLSDGWRAEPWMRIAVTPDVELSVRRTGTKRLARLVAALRRALEDEGIT